MEAGLKKLETREQKYSVELDKALTEYAELKAQTADFDPAELYKARNAIRPVQEKEVEQQLEGTMHEKPFLIMLLSAKQETSQLLGEDAENRQARQMIMRRRSTEQLKRSDALLRYSFFYSGDNDYRNSVVSFCNIALLLISDFFSTPLAKQKEA